MSNWTGSRPVGTYATIPVFGATNWTDVWFGRPVQWCGLVYAEALYRLLRHDTTGPWEQLAEGISLSGIQQSWPSSDAERQGLLPDFFHLRPQLRDGPAINPATLHSCTQRLYGWPGVYDTHHFRAAGVTVHVPGDVVDPAGKDGSVEFRCEGWPEEAYYVLVSGLKAEPRVLMNGQPVALGDGAQYAAAEGRLVLRVRGTPTIVLTTR